MGIMERMINVQCDEILRHLNVYSLQYEPVQTMLSARIFCQIIGINVSRLISVNNFCIDVFSTFK